jgi:hypothetical protein
MQLTDPGPILAKHQRSYFKKFTWIDWSGAACPVVASLFNAYIGNMEAAFWAGVVFIVVMLVIAKEQRIEELLDQGKLAIEQRNMAMSLIQNSPIEKLFQDIHEMHSMAAKPTKKETQH